MVERGIMTRRMQKSKKGSQCNNMNYHNITYPDMNNGDGLRVVLWLSGCSHHCYKCQNPQTWDENSGIVFDDNAKQELFRELEKDYISGITFSGGDPMYDNNVDEVLKLILEIKERFPNKTIWLYTGYYFSECKKDMKKNKVLQQCNVLVDGRYVDSLRDVTLKWRGSKNQNVIDVQQTLSQGQIILWCD